jgi:L-asparaginase
MTVLRRTAITLAVVITVAAAGLVSAQSRKPRVVILATGGTIAGAAATGTQSGYTSGAVGIDTMINACPASRSWPTSRASRLRTSARRT